MELRLEVLGSVGLEAQVLEDLELMTCSGLE